MGYHDQRVAFGSHTVDQPMSGSPQPSAGSRNGINPTPVGAPLLYTMPLPAYMATCPNGLPFGVPSYHTSVDLPVCLYLDHGQDFAICKEVIDGGFSSVMIDGSHLPFEENIALTKQVADYAHDRGVWT